MQKYINTLPSSTSRCTVVDTYNNTAQPHIPVQIAFILTQLPKQFVSNLIWPNPISLNPTPYPRKFKINSTYYTMQNGKKLHSIAVHLKYLPCLKLLWIPSLFFTPPATSFRCQSHCRTNDCTLFFPLPH